MWEYSLEAYYFETVCKEASVEFGRRDRMDKTTIYKLLQKQSLMSVGTSNNNIPDNSVVCFAADEECNLYFGSYSDTLKCKNIETNKNVAITIGTLQIHGIANLVEYGTKEYWEGRNIYDKRFPQYKEVFEYKNNELYRIKPLVIWNYNPAQGEMHRDVLIIDKDYYRTLDVYTPHKYEKR